MHGFHVPNTIGSTPQSNTWSSTWSDFYVEHRFKAILASCNGLGYSPPEIDACCAVIATELSRHSPQPSLLHGDLWGGNRGYADGEPVIFDPATYYGDREADIAMTRLFGGYSGRFYEGYEEEWPLEEGFEERRKTIYNFYHIANHYAMFGGMYYNQARQMFDSILNNHYPD
jgi:fructosamine-3-kinase